MYLPFHGNPPWEVRRSLSEGPDIGARSARESFALMWLYGCSCGCWCWCCVCVHRMLTFAFVCLLPLQQSFISYGFYQCFFMLPQTAPCRTESKWRFCADTMLVSLKKVKSTNRIVSYRIGSFRRTRRCGKKEFRRVLFRSHTRTRTTQTRQTTLPPT